MLDSHSPLEALAFNYLSFAFFAILNNLWTWLALLTAAVSVWRIRATGCPKSSPPPISEISPPESPLAAPSSSAVPASASFNESPLAAPSSSAVPASASFNEVDEVMATKGKFIDYYYEDESEGQNEWENGDGFGYGRDWWASWEQVLKMRKGDMEWYSFQDLTSLNGNVVRLWDGCVAM